MAGDVTETGWSLLPPGQHAVTDFPVVSTTQPPQIAIEQWTLTLTTETGRRRQWDWAAFRALPVEEFVVDLHSVQGWSKLDTRWKGVPMGAVFCGVDTDAEFALVSCYGGYTTNLPLEDLLEMPTWIALGYEGGAIPCEHGGPARLLVPHLYLWKSAKWVCDITMCGHDQPGTRERAGAHNYGDPWRQQRYRDSAPFPPTSSWT